MDIDPFGVRFDAEVVGRLAQGKPRLRKAAPNDRTKLHLPQLIMAIAALPEPARSDQLHSVVFPLENKSFVITQMDFDIVDDDGIDVVLSPLRVSILHSGFQIDFGDRLRALASDLEGLEKIKERDLRLATAVEAHATEVMKGINSIAIRKSADRLLAVKQDLFGQTNAGSALSLVEADKQPEVEIEEISGKEGRLLTRIHVYRERSRPLVKRAKDYYRKLADGKLACEACGFVAVEKYGDSGEISIEAHHKVPLEELQPDSETKTSDLAMVCASCHRVIHSTKPCLTIEDLQQLIANHSLAS